MYLRSSTVYSNTSTDINALLAAANNATPIVTDNDRNYATFTMPSGTSADKHLYLIWDYRNTTAVDLCQDTTSAVQTLVVIVLQLRLLCLVVNKQVSKACKHILLKEP